MILPSLRPSFRPVAACAALLLALAGCGKPSPANSPGAAASPPPVQAGVVTVQPQRVPVRLELVGQVEGSKEVEVRARVSGILQKRLYTEGDYVHAGAPLFQIDPAPFEIALAQAKAQIAQERARNEQAKREAARLMKLAEEKAISQKEYDDATSTNKLSDATLAAAEANLRQAELNLSYTRVTAPVSGISGRVAHSEGSLITTGTDSLLTTINQIDPAWVRFSLAESDLAKLPGGRLGPGAGSDLRLVLPDGADYPGHGRLNFTATQIDPRLATQQLRAEFVNPKHQLLPGQFVRVTLVAGVRDQVYLVPQPAVVQTEKGSLLFVLGADGKAALQPVTLGPWVGSDWMITGGLKPGDRVITDNLLKIRPGSPVSAAAPPKPTEGGAPPKPTEGGAPPKPPEAAPPPSKK